MPVQDNANIQAQRVVVRDFIGNEIHIQRILALVSPRDLGDESLVMKERCSSQPMSNVGSSSVPTEEQSLKVIFTIGSCG